MKVGITGGTGFIGKCLAIRHFDLGDEVRILSRKKFNEFPAGIEIFEGDLCKHNQILDDFVSGIDVLYHCAAEIKDSAQMRKVNVEGTKNLISAAFGKVKHWVQLSSTGVYGPVYSGIVNECQELNADNEYERTKLVSDQLVIDAARNYGFTHCILRPSNVYGSDMSNRSLFQLIRTVDMGVFCFIGPTGANANYITVENVVDALLLCGKNRKAIGKIYNLSDSRTIEHFIGIIADQLSKPYPRLRMPLFLVKVFARLGDLIPGSPLTSSRLQALTSRVYYETRLIEEDLSYVHTLSMEEGMAKLVQAYRKNKY